ncbi:MAG: hypothetical protein ACTHLK_22485 [Brucella intermedia]
MDWLLCWQQQTALRDNINAAIANWPDPKRTIAKNKLASVTVFDRLDALFDELGSERRSARRQTTLTLCGRQAQPCRSGILQNQGARYRPDRRQDREYLGKREIGRGSGWRDLAILISHLISTPRNIVDRYPCSYAIRERDAALRVMKAIGNVRH